MVIIKTTTSDPTVNKTNPRANKSITVDLDFNIVDELKRTRAVSPCLNWQRLLNSRMRLLILSQEENQIFSNDLFLA